MEALAGTLNGVVRRRGFCMSSVRCTSGGGCSSAGRAPRSQRGGQRFDPAQLHQIVLEIREFIWGAVLWSACNCNCCLRSYSFFLSSIRRMRPQSSAPGLIQPREASSSRRTAIGSRMVQTGFASWFASTTTTTLASSESFPGIGCSLVLRAIPRSR